MFSNNQVGLFLRWTWCHCTTNIYSVKFTFDDAKLRNFIDKCK